MEVCELHEEIKEAIRDHERRLVALEKTDASLMERMDAVCRRLEELASRIDKLLDMWNGFTWKFGGGLLAILAGFFIWYVQQLGGR